MKLPNFITNRRQMALLVAVLAAVLAGLLALTAWLSAGQNDAPPAEDSPPTATHGTAEQETPPVTQADSQTSPTVTQPTASQEQPTGPGETQGTQPAPETTAATEPGETSRPTEATEQTQPAETTKPTEPVETTQPTAATEPTQPVQTTPPTEATQPTEPAQTTPPTQPAPPPVTTEPTQATEPEAVVWSSFSAFSGQFVEDGTDRMVENVAAILVTNQSDQFMDLATFTFQLDGKTATFVVTGLPAGRSAWVLEAGAMTVTNESQLTYVEHISSLRGGVYATSDEVSITAEGNVLTAVNNSGRTLENVFIYYKQARSDGSFFGGITYLVDFGTLEPGASARKEAPHYSEDISEIVRIGWTEADQSAIS